MKSFSVALCALFAVAMLQVASAHSESEEMKDVKECSDEHKVTSDDIKAFLAEKDVSTSTKCFMKCLLVRMDVIKDDGTLDVSPAKEHLDDELFSVAQDCTKLEKTEDLCELAYLHGVCMRDKTPSAAKWKTNLLAHVEKL